MKPAFGGFKTSDYLTDSLEHSHIKNWVGKTRKLIAFNLWGVREWLQARENATTPSYLDLQATEQKGRILQVQIAWHTGFVQIWDQWRMVCIPANSDNLPCFFLLVEMGTRWD